MNPTTFAIAETTSKQTCSRPYWAFGNLNSTTQTTKRFQNLQSKRCRGYCCSPRRPPTRLNKIFSTNLPTWIAMRSTVLTANKDIAGSKNAPSDDCGNYQAKQNTNTARNAPYQPSATNRQPHPTRSPRN